MLILIKSLTYNCGIKKEMSCDTAYNLFISCFDKPRSPLKQQIFCDRLNYLKTSKCVNCDVTASMDASFEHNLQPITLPETTLKQSDPNYCQSHVCAILDPLATLSQVYRSVDLFEAGLTSAPLDQGDCGSCWSFGTVSQLENNLLLDANKSIPQVWRQANLSELFLAVNTKGANKFCEGGNFITAIPWLIDQNQTIELASNYPYNAATVAAAKLAYNNSDPSPQLPNKISAQNEYQPFKTFQLQNMNIALTVIFKRKTVQETFNASTIAKIKSYLSRGISVVGSMYVSENKYKFATYNGQGSLEQKCTSFTIDHQIVFVGYGRRGGKDVWMVKDSHGLWAARGFLYFPIGENSFCIEQEALVTLPRYYDMDSGAHPLLAQQMQRAWWQLDSDNRTMVANDGAIAKADPNIGLISGLAVAGGVLVIFVAMVAILKCRQIKRNKMGLGQAGHHQMIEGRGKVI